MTEFLPTMTVAGILALFAPLATTALSRLTWSGTTKQIVAILVAVALAVVAFFGTNGLEQIPGNENPLTYILTIVLVIIAIAQVAYKLIYQRTGIDAKLAAVTATQSEKDAFLAQNTVIGTVDSTESKTADAVLETDATPVPPGYEARH